MRQAWRLLDLNGILYSENQPVAYFKEVQKSPDDEELRNLHKRFWNHNVCPVLVLVSADKVEVFSSRALPAHPGEDPRSQDRLVEVLDRTADVVERLRGLAARIETGRILENARCFRPDQAVDEYLLRNLSDTRKKLLDADPHLEAKTIHALLGRTIFASYLAQRRIINGPFFKSIGASDTADVVELLAKHDSTQAHRLLYKLFRKLQRPFQSSLFADDLDAESQQVLPQHIPVLTAFLQGHEVGSGQQALFSTYDFSLIPVELISAIYEDFLRAEGEGQQEETGAYYTPPQLAELLVDAATDGYETLLDKRFLDPACGSGIFLVTLFTRLAEEWRYKNPRARNKTRARELSRILQENLVGIDINETACRIACFSLYLAFLDHLDPRDIQELTEKEATRGGTFLPSLLNITSTRRLATDPTGTIICRDFFDADLPLTTKFDVIVGNPPWVSRQNVSDDPPAVQWCRKRRLPIPQKQIAYGFLWKCPEHLSSTGRICLLTPTILFVGRTDAFQHAWLLKHRVERLIQLADLRYLLFTHAIRPCAILSYTPDLPSSNIITHDTPLAEFSELRTAIVTVWPDDRKSLQQSDLIEAAAREQAGSLWKIAMRATPRDRRLIDRLLTFAPLERLAKQPDENGRWVVGQGFQPFGGDENPAWWPKNHLFLEAKDGRFLFQLVLTTHDVQQMGDRFRSVHRVRDKRLFKAPLVVFNQGFTRVAYSESDVLFQHALQSVAGPKEDAHLLAFLTGYLQSSLARYLAFHTGGYFGIERDKVSLFEVLRLPFPLPEETSNPVDAAKSCHKAASILTDLRVGLTEDLVDREALISEARRQLDALVFAYFDIDNNERALIEDALKYVVPSATPHRGASSLPMLKSPTARDRKVYVDTICRTLNEWGHRSTYYVNGSVIYSGSSDIAVVTLIKEGQRREYQEDSAQQSLEAALSRIRPLLSSARGGFAYFRNLKVFDGTHVHIIKPLSFRHWMKTTALNDADELAAAILSRGAHGN